MGHVEFTQLLLLLSCFTRVQLYATPQMAAHQAPLSLGFYRQEYWSGLPFLSPMHACMHAKSLQLCPTLCDPTDSSPTRLLCPQDSLGKNTGMGCHFLLQSDTWAMLIPFYESSVCPDTYDMVLLTLFVQYLGQYQIQKSAFKFHNSVAANIVSAVITVFKYRISVSHFVSISNAKFQILLYLLVF